MAVLLMTTKRRLLTEVRNSQISVTHAARITRLECHRTNYGANTTRFDRAHRLIMPDGYSVLLDQFKGLAQIGETGLQDKVNHHTPPLGVADRTHQSLSAPGDAGNSARPILYG